MVPFEPAESVTVMSSFSGTAGRPDTGLSVSPRLIPTQISSPLVTAWKSQ